ncbi:MAG: DUF2807 domain-containing protein [Bacteroidota bacterium]
MLSLLISCQKQEDNRCLKTIGNYKTIVRDVSNFDTLEVYGKIEYIIVQDSIEKVEITAGENMLEFITTENINGRLIIHNKNMCNFLRSYEKNKIKIKIHFKHVSQLAYSGALSLTNLDTITQTNFRLDCWSGNGKINLTLNNYYFETYLHSGAADLYLNGNSEVRNLYSGNSSFCYETNFSTNLYIVNHNGTGDYYIGNCINADILIQKLGNVYYKGNPNFINKKIEGKGKLIKDDA